MFVYFNHPKHLIYRAIVSLPGLQVCRRFSEQLVKKGVETLIKEKLYKGPKPFFSLPSALDLNALNVTGGLLVNETLKSPNPKAIHPLVRF